MRKAENIESISPNTTKVTEFLMQNANKANEIIATGLVNLGQMINIGAKDINSLCNFFTYDKVYIQYVKEGLVTADKLLQLVNTPDGQTSFKSLGMYSNAVYKLCKYGMTFDKLIMSGLENVNSLALLLRNVDAVIYFTTNNNLYSLKYLYQLGCDDGETQSILLKNLNSIILLAENNETLSTEKIRDLELMNIDAIECLLKYSDIYVKYIMVRLITFDKLFLLIEDKARLTVFKALGEYSDAVETLLNIFVPFVDLYNLGFNEPKKFTDLLKDINNPDSQLWIMEHSHVINDIYIKQVKLDIFRVNVVKFSLFMRRYNCRIDDILKLPLTVLENFVENDFQDVILINEIFGGVRLLSSIRTKHADFGNAIFSSQEPHY